MAVDQYELQAKLTELEQRVTALESRFHDTLSQSTETKRDKSMREFLNEKKPSTANDRGLCIAYYYEILRSYDCFNAEDIKRGFQEARIPLPKNPNDVINKNIAKAYMMDSPGGKDGKKAWILTGTGIEVVEKGFDKDN